MYEKATCVHVVQGEPCNTEIYEVNNTGAGWCPECRTLYTGPEVTGIQRVIDILDAFKGRTDTIGEADYDDYASVLQWIYNEAKKQQKDSPLSLTPEELGTVLAALRHYQSSGMGDPSNRPLPIHEIATDGGELVSLDDEDIDALCERLNLRTPLVRVKKEVEHVLVAHTSHVSPETAGRLEAGEGAKSLPAHASIVPTSHGQILIEQAILPAFTREEGWFLHVGEDLETWPDADDLEKLYLKAKEAGCCWILLDPDGPVHEGLQTWDW